jgi:Glycosyl transferases group 1
MTDMDLPFHGLRVVHAANYQMDKDGAAFFNCDLKFHQGLVQNGCQVYPFSINDRARMLSFLNSKTFGKNKANRALIKTCRNVRPDALVLGHGQYLSRETLSAIRETVPNIRIGYWYIDPLWEPKDVAHLNHRADLFDAVCCTTGGDLLKQFCRAGCPAAFVPNPVEAGVERLRAFECDSPVYDLVFFGRDKYASQRGQFLADLREALPQVRFGYFGCLGEPLVFGAEKDAILSRSRMALNLSRRNDVELYSSDRIAQLTGNGLLTLIQTGAGFEELYSDDEVGFYETLDDLIELVAYLVSDDQLARSIAERGWRKAHSGFSSQSVVEFLLNLTFRRTECLKSPWAPHIHWHAEDDTRPVLPSQTADRRAA